MNFDSYFNLAENTTFIAVNTIFKNFIDNDKISLQGMLGNSIFLL